jgi:hypothetical protein
MATKLDPLFQSIIFADNDRSIPSIVLTPKEYATVRASLLRKYKQWVNTCAASGDTSWQGKYIKASHDLTTYLATFELRPKEAEPTWHGKIAQFQSKELV